MENNLKELIIKIKENDNKSIERLILIFEKIINKYSRKLDSEDTKQDLIIFLINIVFNMKITQQSSYTDKQIFSYISKSLSYDYDCIIKKAAHIEPLKIFQELSRFLLQLI